MRSKFLPTSHIIVHGPKRKNFKQKKLNSNLHAKQIQKETSIFICQNVHKITHLQNFHTNIQILQNSN